jgi:hypothetical protein
MVLPVLYCIVIGPKPELYLSLKIVALPEPICQVSETIESPALKATLASVIVGFPESTDHLPVNSTP